MPPIDPNNDIDSQIWDQINYLEGDALLAAMAEAISSIRPSADWTMKDGDVSKINWIDGSSVVITEEQIRQKMFDLRKERYLGLQNKDSLKQSATQKLLDSGLTQEEINALLG